MNLRLGIDDFIRLTNARFVDAAVDPGGSENGSQRD
jgi:hypothetical protein